MQTLETLFDRTPDTLEGFSTATTAIGAVLLSIAYASSVPQPRLGQDVEVLQTESTALETAHWEPAMELLALLRIMHGLLAIDAVELPVEDARILYENLWDLYEA